MAGGVGGTEPRTAETPEDPLQESSFIRIIYIMEYNGLKRMQHKALGYWRSFAGIRSCHSAGPVFQPVIDAVRCQDALANRISHA